LNPSLRSLLDQRGLLVSYKYILQKLAELHKPYHMKIAQAQMKRA